MRPFTTLTAFLLALISMGALLRAEGEPAKIGDFFGEYRGHSTSISGEGFGERDFDVTIWPFQADGFSVGWNTVIRYADGKIKRKGELVHFLPAKQRPGLYYAVLKTDRAGVPEAVDPLSGTRYIWAALRDKTLFVRALQVEDDGGYEIQSYSRTLTAPDGMHARFELVRNGAPSMVITGDAKKVAAAKPPQ